MSSSEELNRILHQPIRTRIVAHLIAHGKTDYNSIKKTFDLSDGHMTTHMRELLAHDYVIAEKLSIDNKSRTIYHITDSGRAAFVEYVETLKKIITFG
jgi:DNA-binding MarR family transcriptional regulator